MSNYKILQKISHNKSSGVYLIQNIRTFDLRVLAIISKKDSDCSIDSLKCLIMHNSPYIAQIYDVFEECGRVFIIEEYILGETLGQIIRKRENISNNDKIKWKKEIYEGLEYLHKIKPLPIFHGDVHPDNIMINTDRQVKLIDFSSIKTGCFLSRIHAVREFLDPRILNGNPYDREADVYSLEKTMKEFIL